MADIIVRVRGTAVITRLVYRASANGKKDTSDNYFTSLQEHPVLNHCHVSEWRDRGSGSTTQSPDIIQRHGSNLKIEVLKAEAVVQSLVSATTVLSAVYSLNLRTRTDYEI